MLSKPLNGRSTIEIRNISNAQEKQINLKWKFNYMFNTPLEILEAIAAALQKKRTQVVELDLEEEGDGTILISPNSLRCIRTSYLRPTVYYKSVDEGYSLKSFSEEVCNDIKENINEWSYFWNAIDGNSIKENKEKIEELLSVISNYIE